MARKEAVNTFTDGMVSDLNPINTPNTVLTDCLNGTLITYNGNEFTLQNDKGNYPLRNCKLPENYIPVGVKEYGDILYIVSYNPVDKRVQVGSYPSPQTIYDNITEKTRRYDEVNANNIVSPQIVSIWRSGNYTELSEGEDLQLFYGGTKPEIWKLNPGDLYKLNSVNGNQSVAINTILAQYEELEFYVMDDDKKIHKIKSGDIYINQLDFKHIKWSVPGYLATKTRLAELDDFNVNTKKIKVRKYEIAAAANAIQELKLNFQILCSDHLINDQISGTNQPDLFIRVSYTDETTSGNNWTNYDIPMDGYVENGNGEFCHYINWTPNLSGLDHAVIALSNDKIQFTLVPVLKYDGVEIVYDNLQKVVRFDLSSKGNVNEFTIGDATWKWNVDDNLTLRFDTGGVQENAVFDKDLFVRCSISRFSGINGNGEHEYIPVTDGNNILLQNVLLESLGCEWSVHGITELTLPFKPFPNNSTTYNANKNYLYAEDCYEVQFNFYESIEGGNPLRAPIKKFVLTTKLLNGNTSSRYDQVTFDKWFPNYEKFINNKFYQVNSTVDYSNAVVSVLPEDMANYNLFINKSPLKHYPSFSVWPSAENSPNLTEDMVDNGFDITATAKFPISTTYTNSIELPVGPMWLGLSGLVCYSESNNIYSQQTINPYTGKDSSQLTDSTNEGVFKKYIHVILKPVGDRTFDLYNNNGLDNNSTVATTNKVLNINGWYENKIEDKPRFGVDPDIEVVFDGVATVYRTPAESIDINNTTIKSICSYLNEYDALFITMTAPAQTEGDNGPNNNELKVGTYTTNTTAGLTFFHFDYVYNTATTTTGFTSYWAVFKTTKHELRGGNVTQPLFVKINAVDSTSATTNFYNMVNAIKHIKSDDRAYHGIFIKTAVSPEKTSLSLSSDDFCKVEFSNDWLYNGIQMFSDNRMLIDDHNSKFFNISKDSSNFYNNLNSIDLLKNSNDLVFDESRLNSNMSTMLQVYTTTLTERNTTVQNEIDLLLTDPISNNTDFIGQDVYTGPSNYEQFVNILNGNYICDVPLGVRAFDHYNPDVYPGVSGYGNQDFSQWLRIGISDKNLSL